MFVYPGIAVSPRINITVPCNVKEVQPTYLVKLHCFLTTLARKLTDMLTLFFVFNHKRIYSTQLAVCINQSTILIGPTSWADSSALPNLLFLLQETIHNCHLLKEYTILVKSEAGEIAYSETVQSAGVVNITDLEGFTNYTVEIIAVNDRNLSSQTVQSIITVETSMCS